MLVGICFGKFYFEVALALRENLLKSSLLTNSESWYNLALSDIRELESVDDILLRKVLECPMSTPREIHRVLKTKLSHPMCNDWCQTVVNDLQKLERKLVILTEYLLLICSPRGGAS